jgi:glycosyltransferase involved in cell wall biosynthesis
MGPEPRSILLASYFFPPAREVAARRPAALARYLRERGHEVTILTTSAYGESDDETGVIRSRDLQLVQARLRGRRRAEAIFDSPTFAERPHLVSRLVVPDAHRLAWSELARITARRLARERRFDCVLTTSPPESGHLIGEALRRHGVAWVADLRDGWVFESMKDRIWLSDAQHRYSARMERRLLRRADAVTAVTQPIVDDLAERLGIEARLVPNGWDPAARVDEAAGRSLLDPERASLVFTGQLGGARRDPEPLIGALAGLARGEPELAGRLELVFAGSFTEREQALFVTEVDPARIKVLAPLEDETVLGLQRAADATLLITGPRRQEASLKLFEYIGAGNPVVAITGGDTAAARIVRESGAGISVEPSDRAGIEEALRRVAAGDLPAADERARAAWGWPRIAELMDEAVEAAIAGRARAPR